MQKATVIERRYKEHSKCPFCQSEDWEIIDAENGSVIPEVWNLELKCRACGHDWCEAWFY